jgi:hypothetical protein
LPVFCLHNLRNILLTGTKKIPEADEAGQNHEDTKYNLTNSPVVYNAATRQGASIIDCCKNVEKSMHLVHNIPTHSEYNHPED